MFSSVTLKRDLYEEELESPQIWYCASAAATFGHVPCVASGYVLEIWSSPVTHHTTRVYRGVSAERPGVRAGVTIPIDFWSPWFGLSGYCHLYISKGFSTGLSSNSCPQLKNLDQVLERGVNLD